MWIRKCYLDDASDIQSPIPTRMSSNEEFVPPPQSDKQKEWENRLRELADRNARRLGISRRAFLQTSAGTAAAMLCFNQVFGKTYEVDPIEALDPAAFEERWPKNEFIFDNQTHHIDIESGWFEKTEAGKQAFNFLRRFRPNQKTTAGILEALNETNYVKELFFDSDTVMAIISGVPTEDWKENILPPDKMVKTRNDINAWAGSQRMLSHGLLRPNMTSAKEMEEMERQAKTLKINSWKMYPGSQIGGGAYWLDDEKVSYPFWEKTRKLGIKNLCIHKGLPLGVFNERACQPLDLEKAAQDWPDLNFIVYHSGYRGSGRLAGGTGEAVKDSRTDDPQEIPWISDIFRILKRNPGIKNIYFELGSTFGQLSAAQPEKCMHMLGQMIQTAGADHILWGTDSIWGGSPQSQIDRLRRLKMKPQLVEQFRYPELIDAIKNQILGLNAARLFGIDPAAKRQAIQADKLSDLRREYRRNPAPSNTQYGWVWVEDGRDPSVPVGS
jgi:predicted TIM-barrel fold metal-dependent hydrolase